VRAREEGGGVMYWGVYRGGPWGRDLSGVRSRGLWLQRMGLANPWSALKEQSMSVLKAASGASSSASAAGSARNRLSHRRMVSRVTLNSRAMAERDLSLEITPNRIRAIKNSLTAVSRPRAMESRSATTGLRSTQPEARAPARWQGRGAARGRWVRWRQQGSLRRCHPWGRLTGQGAPRHLNRDVGTRPRDPGGVLAFPPWPAPAWVKAKLQRWISSDV
jgi:hypothetical protein